MCVCVCVCVKGGVAPLLLHPAEPSQDQNLEGVCIHVVQCSLHREYLLHPIHAVICGGGSSDFPDCLGMVDS